MTNIYDVLGKLHVSASASVENTVKEALQVKDPPKLKAMEILAGEDEDTSADEDSQGDDRTGSNGDDQ